MRLFPVLVLSMALATASAGCFGKDDGDDGTNPPTPTPTGTSPTGGATPTPTTTPTVTPTPTTPPKPAPKELCAVTKDFSTQQPAPPATTITSTGTCGAVTAGYTKIAINGNFTANAGAPVQLAEGINVKVLDAAGTAVLTCVGPPTPGQAATIACAQEVAAAAGDHSLLFEGAGTVTFTGSVTVS